ncbi:MAG: hypothetical protein U0R71_04485 [Solirubrobacterales bacterium]
MTPRRARPLLALAALALLTSVAARPAHAATPTRLAVFSVGVRAEMKVTWSKDLSASCGGSGLLRTLGNGETTARLHSTSRRTVILERNGGGVALSFPDGGLPVAGSVARRASVEGFTVAAPATGACPDPLPVAPDCGSRPYPADATVAVAYTSPDRWPYAGPPPLTDTLVVTGPSSEERASGPAFVNCPTVGRDDQIGAQEGAEATPPVAIPVSVRSLLRRERFVLRRRDLVRLDAAELTTGIDGTIPVRFETKVALSFVRLRQPRR